MNVRAEGFRVDKDYMRPYVNPAEFLERQKKKLDDEKAAGQEVPRAAAARRAGLPARARPAGGLGARHPLHRARRGLLLRAAGPDQDHERGLGQLLALHHHDHPRAARSRDHRLRRSPLRHDGHPAGQAEPVQDGHRAVPRHRGPLEQGPLRQGLGRVRRPARAPPAGTRSSAAAARRSSRCASTTTTSPSSTPSSRPSSPSSRSSSSSTSTTRRTPGRSPPASSRR